MEQIEKIMEEMQKSVLAHNDQERVVDTVEKLAPSSERFVFTAYNGQRVELNGADMRRVKRYYEEQSTADYLRENNPTWTEEKVQAVAIDTHIQMFKYDVDEAEAINEVLAEFEATHYVELASKQVPDSDSFMTDYTMYRDTYTGEYVFIFGDKEVYTPENTEANWKCEVEKIAIEWFGDYKGFDATYDPYKAAYEIPSSEKTDAEWNEESKRVQAAVSDSLSKLGVLEEHSEESIILRQFAFPKELRGRVTNAAVSLVEFIKNTEGEHYVDVSESGEIDIASAEKMIALNQTDTIISQLREYHTEHREAYLQDANKINELRKEALLAVGTVNGKYVQKYAESEINAETAKVILGNTAYQLATLYKEEKVAFENSAPCRAKELLTELVNLKRDIYIARYENLEPDVLFSDDDYLAVYQLKAELWDFNYKDYDYFKDKGKDISLSDYEPVYVERLDDTSQVNEELFYRFNMEHPVGYVGHSLSVSDIIVKHRFGITDVSFTDTVGFQPIAFFVKEYALETNHLMHLIRQDGDSYVCQSYEKEGLSLHHTEKLKLHQVGDHVRALDSLEDTYMKRCDVADLKEKIESAQQEMEKTELKQIQHTRKPRL